jgi:hypothetical protein
VEAGDILLHVKWPIFVVRGKKYKNEKAVEGQKHQILWVEVVCAMVRVVDQRDLLQYLSTPLFTAGNARTLAFRVSMKTTCFHIQKGNTPAFAAVASSGASKSLTPPHPRKDSLGGEKMREPVFRTNSDTSGPDYFCG